MTLSRPLRRDAAVNRERVLSAASDVFARHGLDGGVEEIAKLAGVGMGTLYRRFPTKQALIDELVGDLRRQLLALAQDAAGRDDGSGLEEFLAVAGALQASQSGCLPQLWNRSDAESDALAELRRLIGVLLADAQRHGRIRPEITETDISMMFWSIRAVIETSGSVAPLVWRRHLELLVAGLRPGADERFASPLTEAPLTPAQAHEIAARAITK